VWKFSTTLAGPVLLLPTDAAINISTTPVFIWKATDGATRYTLQVSARSDMCTPLFDQSDIPDTLYNASGLAINTKYYWRVAGINGDGQGSYSSIRSFTTTQNTDVDPSASIAHFRLEQNYPNPFSETTSVQYTLAVPSEVEVSVYSLTGSFLKSLAKGYEQAGKHFVEWNGEDDFASRMPGGIYFIRFFVDGYMVIRPVLYIR